MILLADAGATKINWAIIYTNKVCEFTTSGYNPNVADSNFLRQLLISGFPANFNPTDIKTINYFGTGCGSAFGKERVEKALQVFFTKSIDIKIMTDLEGAAMAVFKNTEGVIGILGTGSNAGFYNGKAIIKSPISLGYLIGDEGSGAYLGKILLSKILRAELPIDIVDCFYSNYSLTSAELIKNVYSAPQPNRYLASFVPFIRQNIQSVEIEKILLDAFELYCQKFMKPVINNQKNISIGMIGGVANAFSSQLNRVFNEQGLGACTIIDAPLTHIIKHYLS